MVRDYGEVDMASSDTLSAFIKRAFERYPPSTSGKCRGHCMRVLGRGNRVGACPPQCGACVGGGRRLDTCVWVVA